MGVSASSMTRNRNRISRDILTDEEVTIFPDSAAVLNISDVSETTSLTDGESVNLYDNVEEGGSEFFVTWKKTEHVFYFGIVIIFIILLCIGLYFVYNLLLIRKGSSVKVDKYGVKWTRLRGD
nr:protein m40 [Mastomys natalensis cytomegalovirus 3]WEG69873.1 protein m40 [Mastomys natalensis cytomegalovirus 3]WEG70013.1 protein m40 [Mastomys natalensis cytomegalovirus 3]WEG70153.1 protein m40 [Mastomys natalensis cytomegalovirus 3]WEG70293.1 protein m40 [Mastomys natalensis cytomegalovirus 3]